MIEFIFDEKSGEWMVIEINGRPWLMIDFFRRLGMNFLDIKEAYCGQIFKPINGFEEYIHVHIPSALEVSTSQGSNPNLIDFLKSFEKKITFTHLDPDDPEPGYKELHRLCKANEIDQKKLIADIEKLAAC